MNAELIEIKNLHVSFAGGDNRGLRERNGRVSGEQVPRQRIRAVRGLDFSLRQGELHSLVGESGSGKTVTSTAVMGLLPSLVSRIDRGEILLRGRNLLTLNQEEMRKLRGTELAMVFQEPARYLNPAFRVGEQIGEMIRLHKGLSRADAVPEVLKVLEQAGMDNPRRAADSYPHELSGGMKQRAMIALAICCDPSVLIADEPTTALDVTLQLQILRLILQIRDSRSMGILFISHDLRVVRDISDRVSVIYAGKIVETADSDEFFSRPLHPYSVLLLGSIPDGSKRGIRLSAIQGKVPDPSSIPGGCAFHPRCPRSKEICTREQPSLREHGGNHQAACHMLEVL